MTPPPSNPVEQEALEKALESNFDVMNMDIGNANEDEFDLDWREEIDDLWPGY